MSKVDIHAKEAQATEARERFMSTLHELQHRLSPKSIANDVKEIAKEKADGLKNAAREGAVQAATHPSTVAAITIPILVYFFRKPIARGVNALFRQGEGDVQEPVPPYEAARTPAPITAEPTRARDKAPAEQGA